MISIFAILFFPVAMVQRIPILLWYCHGATSLTLRIAHQLVNRVITCSPEGFRLKSRKIKIIGHGINTEVFKPSGMKHSNGCRLLTVGRLSPVKHCDILIQAVKEVIAAGNKSIQYTIAGGPERSDPATFATYLRQLVDDNNLQDVIAFRGPVSFYDVPELYRDADLFLNASSTGSLDKAVLEAMSCGCVVLTSNPPYKTVFGDLADLLFVPQNHPADFAAAIKRIIVLSPQERTMIGNRLRNIVLTHHSLERLTSQIVHELESLHGAYRQ